MEILAAVFPTLLITVSPDGLIIKHDIPALEYGTWINSSPHPSAIKVFSLRVTGILLAIIPPATIYGGGRLVYMDEN